MDLRDHRYGKAGVRVVKVLDGGGIVDVEVSVHLEGDFSASYLEGDNSRVVPTDTMRNVVYALAQDHLTSEVERFGKVLCDHFADLDQVERVDVQVESRLWSTVDGHPHTQVASGPDRRTARVTVGEGEVEVESGIAGLRILKTTGSAFAGFPRDRFTTLPEAADRLLATSIDAGWGYLTEPADYTELWWSVRDTLVGNFAARPSRSVQEQGYLMGEAVLDAHPEIGWIRLRLPNIHHLEFDLTRFDMPDRKVVFYPVDEPYGDIHLMVSR
jgi:urate oxidase